LDVDKILRTGYFDNLKIDGTIYPILHSNGTLVMPDMSFKDMLEKSSEGFKHGVANIKIQLIGESNIDANIEELEQMRDDREISGIKRLPCTSLIDRYLVAYVDILLLKNIYSMPYNLETSGRDRESLIKVGDTPDITEILLASLELAEIIENKYNYPRDCIAIAIINKVYIFPSFRRSGISTWLHVNMADIINMYGMVYPTGIMLTYGDFSHEANRYFNMENSSYNKMLKTHYKELGYKKFNIGNPQINIGDKTNIMYKILV